LAPGLNKRYLPQQEIFNNAYLQKDSLKNLNKIIKTNANENEQETVQKNYNNHLLAELYSFSDSSGIDFQFFNLFYKREGITKDIDLGVDAGIFTIEKEDYNRYRGKRYGVSLFYKNLQLRLGKNDFDDFSQVVPSIFYKNSYKKHSYSLQYTYQNALFYTYTLAPYEKRINAHHISISDYITLKNQKNIWANIQINHFDNSDTELTAQFDWRFFYDSLFHPKFSYDFALEGWYTSHTKENSDFYSPSFADATLLRIDPHYLLNKYFGIRATLGTGYSFSDQQMPYKYGLWIFGNPLKRLSYSAGCLRSNASRGNYEYDECRASMEYKW